MYGIHPLVAQTIRMRQLSGLTTHSCVRIMAVRDGSAIIGDSSGQRPTRAGDVLLVGANVTYSVEPEGEVTATTVDLDSGYAVDQFYWQHTEFLLDRLEAQDVAAVVFSEPVQVLRLGEQRLSRAVPWLDELAELSKAGNLSESFTRMQALWFLLADAIRPFLNTVHVVEALAQSAKARQRSLRHRRLGAPVRIEALTVRGALHGNLARRWLLDDLAEMVHLSPKQLARVFSLAYGRTPCEYLARLRAEAMARLLREENLTVEAAAHRVGWSRNHATEIFARHVGVTPGRYRIYGLPSTLVGSGAHLSGEPRLSRPENGQRS